MNKIHKEVYGQGKSLVLIHGWAMHTGIWRDFAQKLGEQYQVICLDLPGHGLSESIKPYTLDQICMTLIEELPESFSILGWSLGASVALTMAKNFPQRVSSLILMSGNPRFVKDKDWSGTRTEVLEGFGKNLTDNCEQTLTRFLALQVFGLPDGKNVLTELKQVLKETVLPTEKALQSSLDILKYTDLRNAFKLLPCPINLIQGDKDTLVPVQASLDMQKLKPTCNLNIIDGAGHVPFLSHQSQVIEAISKFL